jgi:hopanoid-associated phosphorylase
MALPLPLVVVVGMTREARIVSGEGVTVLIGGGQSARLGRQLEEALAAGAAGAVSFGLCGALHPDLDAGDIVADSDDPEWLNRLRTAIPQACAGRVIGGDVMVASVRRKASLLHESGADAVDMESHILTACARRAGTPYAVVRAVSDPADRALPTCALAGIKPNGDSDTFGVLAALARRPWEAPALLRTAWEARRAFAALADARAALGATLGCPRLAAGHWTGTAAPASAYSAASL